MAEQNKMNRWVVYAIMALAMLPRIVLGLINNEANDNHIDVVNIIADQNRLPDKSECWSCYQPKLYYVVCAKVVKVFHLNGYNPRVKAMQMINVLAALLMLLVFASFINKQNILASTKYLVFALFAFNACLLGINIQGTNDTLAILFGILVVYAADIYFKRKSIVALVAMALFLIAGALTKASAFILFLTIFIAFVLQFATQINWRSRLTTIRYLALVVITFLVVVPSVGGYYHNYKKYGSLTLSTWEKDPPPHFFEKTFVMRQGLRSIADGYFTFRYFDMIRQPYINNEWNNFPEHRTSLWSQLYGRTAFMHFDQWPMSWQTQSVFIVWVGRLLIILGIVPLLIFLLGIGRHVLSFINATLGLNRAYFANADNYFMLAVTLAMFASSMYYTYNYRDFSSMKSIYIFPGLIAFIKMFADGMAIVQQTRLMAWVRGVLGLIIALSIADVSYLIYQLK